MAHAAESRASAIEREVILWKWAFACMYVHLKKKLHFPDLLGCCLGAKSGSFGTVRNGLGENSKGEAGRGESYRKDQRDQRKELARHHPGGERLELEEECKRRKKERKPFFTPELYGFCLRRNQYINSFLYTLFFHDRGIRKLKIMRAISLLQRAIFCTLIKK